MCRSNVDANWVMIPLLSLIKDMCRVSEPGHGAEKCMKNNKKHCHQQLLINSSFSQIQSVTATSGGANWNDSSSVQQHKIPFNQNKMTFSKIQQNVKWQDGMWNVRQNKRHSKNKKRQVKWGFVNKDKGLNSIREMSRTKINNKIQLFKYVPLFGFVLYGLQWRVHFVSCFGSISTQWNEFCL